MEGGGTAGPGITNVKKDLWFPVVSEGDWLLRQKKMIHNLTPEKNNTQFNEYPWVNKPCLAGAQNSQINPRVWWSPLAFHGGLGTRKSHKIERMSPRVIRDQRCSCRTELQDVCVRLTSAWTWSPQWFPHRPLPSHRLGRAHRWAVRTWKSSQVVCVIYPISLPLHHWPIFRRTFQVLKQ